jgi:hypothetical protein
MVDNGTYTAILDRFEDKLAVLVLESDGESGGLLIVESGLLPSDGQHQDALFTVEVREDELVDATYHSERTEQRQESAQSRFDQLSERSDRDE